MPDKELAPSLRPGWRLLVAAVPPLLVWLITVGVMSWRPDTRGIDVAVGSSQFRDYCGACHIVEKGITTHHGPNLFDIGKVAAQRKPGMTSAEYILESILDPAAFVLPTNQAGMPKNIARDLSPKEIRDIVAYLASRGAVPNYRELAALEIPDLRDTSSLPTPIRRDQMLLAEQVLRTKAGCLACHSLFRNAEHQILAPPLFAMGLKDKELTRQSILDPSKEALPIYCSATVVLQNGQVITGRIISQTAERLLIISRDEEGRLVQHNLPMSQVEQDDGQPLLRHSSISLMPSGFDALLSSEELEALVALIDQLN
jgi:putative heme-binding domain-containing protein